MRTPDELLESWINGNRSAVRVVLLSLTRREALATFAAMLADATPDTRTDLIRDFARL